MAGKGKQVQPAKSSKVAVDKTFGMKNKKGGAAQKTIKHLQLESPQLKRDAEAAKARERKLAEDRLKKDADMLNTKPAQIQKVPFGTDPKTVPCIFFKKGNCEKGNKCKFSHAVNADIKVAKASLYVDPREAEEEARKKETSDDWDESKLMTVILSKKGNQRTTTDKVCKYFISAIEDGKYGWFWICPNDGDKCMYKHALPPGFVLKTKEQRAAEKALLDKSPLKTLTLEEFLESERHKLTGTLTPVTAESFAKWKKERMDKKAAAEQLRQAKEATGRALFESGNWRTQDDSDEEPDEDDGAWNLEKMRQETEAMRERKEEERLAATFGGPAHHPPATNMPSAPDDDANDDANDDAGDDDDDDAAGPSGSKS